MNQSSFWIGLAIAALVLVAILLIPAPPSTPVETIRFEAQDPWAIGSIEDAFDYAGQSALTIQGTATLQIDPTTKTGTLEISLQPSAALEAWLGDTRPESSITLRMQFDDTNDVWADIEIHGESGIGDSRLPTTHVIYAGYGPFELLIDGTMQIIEWTGFWSIGDALRQSDGAIRNQGLVFTPLLRDQSVFSDPTRMEITLLLYETPDSDNVIFHLVFPKIRIVGG